MDGAAANDSASSAGVRPRKTPPSELRVLIGLTEISGYACNLRAGFRELGVQADLLNLQPPTFSFGDDTPPTRLMRLLQRVSRARLAAGRRAPVRRHVLEGIQIVLTPVALVQALRRYNTFVFLYDTSFLRQRELPLLRLLRKRIVYVFCGSDDRPTYLDGGLMESNRGSIDSCIASVRRKKRMLRRVERHATVILTNPSHGLLHERPFVSFPTVGIPRALHDEMVEVSRSSRLKIIHAPSHPVAKGTEVIRTTINRLHTRGYDFDYEEVQGVPNPVLRERLRGCDFVVDQVWGDTPMDGLAADAGLYGKPTIVSGYAWDELRKILPDDAFPPSELCSPEGLEDAIVRLLTDDDHRLELGARAHAFVTERWNATAVAQRFLDLLDEPPPAEWLHEPSELRSLLGWGQPAERSLELVRAIVERAGTDALGLGDKPEAEAALLAAAFEIPAARSEEAIDPAEIRGMRSLLADSAAYGLGVAALPIALLLATPVIARKVGPVGFGAIDLLTTILTLASVAALLGIDAGLIRSYLDYDRSGQAQRRAAISTAFVSVLTVSTALALMLGLVGVFFAGALGTSPQSMSRATIVAAFALLPFSSTLLIARVTLRLQRRRGLYAAIAVTQAVAGVAAAVTLVVLGTGPAGYFIGLAVGALAALSLCLIAGVFFRDGVVINRTHLRTMLSYGVPLVPAAFATWVAFAIDRTLLASMRGLLDVGYYAMASKLAAPLFIALNAFTIAWIPFILEQPPHRRLELRARALTAVAAAIGIGFILLLLLAPQLVDLLGGPTFHHSLRAVPGIAIGWLAWGLAFVLATEFMVSRRTKVIAVATGISALANVALNLILIPPFGFAGASWATAMTFVLLATIYFAIERRSTPAPYRWRRLLVIGLVLAAGAGLLIPASFSLSHRLLFALGAVTALAAIAATDRSARVDVRAAVDA